MRTLCSSWEMRRRITYTAPESQVFLFTPATSKNEKRWDISILGPYPGPRIVWFLRSTQVFWWWKRSVQNNSLISGTGLTWLGNRTHPTETTGSLCYSLETHNISVVDFSRSWSNVVWPREDTLRSEQVSPEFDLEWDLEGVSMEVYYLVLEAMTIIPPLSATQSSSSSSIIRITRCRIGITTNFCENCHPNHQH